MNSLYASTTISDAISTILRREDEQKRKEHNHSGKLSASRLGYPLQWQVLHSLGVEGKEADDYTLAKFRRGEEVENFIVKTLEKSKDIEVLDIQREEKYKDCVGLLDIFIKYKGKYLPVEVKSVTNMAFKWIVKENTPKLGHTLQSTLYGLSEETEYTSVLYVASDDYRTLHFIFKTEEHREQVESIIENYNKAMKAKQIPIFKAIEKWQENHTYNMFPKFTYLTEKDLLAYKHLFNKKKEGE